MGPLLLHLTVLDGHDEVGVPHLMIATVIMVMVVMSSSTSLTVERRCAITKVVRPEWSLSRAAWIMIEDTSI